MSNDKEEKQARDCFHTVSVTVRVCGCVCVCLFACVWVCSCKCVCAFACVRVARGTVDGFAAWLLTQIGVCCDGSLELKLRARSLSLSHTLTRHSSTNRDLHIIAMSLCASGFVCISKFLRTSDCVASRRPFQSAVEGWMITNRRPTKAPESMRWLNWFNVLCSCVH